MKVAALKLDAELEVTYDSEEFEEILSLFRVMLDEDNQEYSVEASVTHCDGLVCDIHIDDISIGLFAVSNVCHVLGYDQPERLTICDEVELHEILQSDYVDTDVYVIPLIGDLPCV